MMILGILKQHSLKTLNQKLSDKSDEYCGRKLPLRKCWRCWPGRRWLCLLYVMCRFSPALPEHYVFWRACVCGSRSRSKRNLEGIWRLDRVGSLYRIVFSTATARRVVVVDRGGRGVKVIKWTTERKKDVWLQMDFRNRVSRKWPPVRTIIRSIAAPATSWWARWRYIGGDLGCYTAPSCRSWLFYTQDGCMCGSEFTGLPNTRRQAS